MSNFKTPATVSLHVVSATHTGGVSRVDDAQDPGVAVLSCFGQWPPEFCNVQTPTLLLIQVVIDLHGSQVGEGGRVQRVLRDGDHHPRAVATLTTHQQLQHGLESEEKKETFILKNIDC